MFADNILEEYLKKTSEYVHIGYGYSYRYHEFENINLWKLYNDHTYITEEIVEKMLKDFLLGYSKTDFKEDFFEIVFFLNYTCHYHKSPKFDPEFVINFFVKCLNNLGFKINCSYYKLFMTIAQENTNSYTKFLVKISIKQLLENYKKLKLKESFVKKYLFDSIIFSRNKLICEDIDDLVNKI